MKKLKYSGLKCLIFALCMALLAGTAAPVVRALPEETEPVVQEVFLDSYKITGEKIVPGNEFTLTLTLENTAATAADHVVLDVFYPVGVMPVYGSVSQAIVDIPAEGTIDVPLQYKALDRIGTPVLDFQVSIREKELQNVTLLRTPVGLESPFDVIAAFVPDRAMVGESVNCSMTFKYLGMEATEKLQARMDVNGDTVYTADIGQITKDTTKTQSLMKEFNEPGQHTVELYLDYRDESGDKKSVLMGRSIIEIRETQQTSVQSDTSIQENQQHSEEMNMLKDHTAVLSICGVFIALSIAGIVFLIQKKK